MVNFEFNKYKNIDYDNLNLNFIYTQLKNDNAMFDWHNLDEMYVDDIIETSDYVRKNSDVFIVLGAGGSVNCSRAIINAFKPYFKSQKPEIIYLGDSLSSDYLLELLEYLKDKKIFVNIVSKSAKTLETNLLTDVILYLMKKKYSASELKKRVIVTSENEDNYLTRLAREHGFKRYIISKNITGRFSMFTPVGLFPMAVAGIDIKMLLLGAHEVLDDLTDCYRYTLYRHHMYLNNLVVESFNIYEPKLQDFGEWVKQLFAESHGKNGKGILPILNINTKNLHSMGQYLQDGLNIVFETNILCHSKKTTKISKYNKTLDEINTMAAYSVALAHFNNNKNSIIMEMDKIDELNLGYLAFFFMLSAALGSYLLKVNYYDEPGVNEYKEILLSKVEE